jgi:DNA-binding MurR/RpiR family transcriptional regulator
VQQALDRAVVHLVAGVFGALEVSVSSGLALTMRWSGAGLGELEVVPGDLDRHALLDVALGALQSLEMIRPAVHLVQEHNIARDLADAGPNDVAVVFDFFRYRRTTVLAAETLASLGATILAITDGPLSPLAAMTEHWCQLVIPAVGPFDSSVPAVAAAELLVAQVSRDLKTRARDRIDRTESLWEATGTFCP